MDFISEERIDGLAQLTLRRGRVNALNNDVVDELRKALEALEHDQSVRSVVITARGSFFSFGFDIPNLMPYSRDDFLEWLKNFTDLYTYLFLYPKPVVAALNGHTIAGGCMLALACDYRVMAAGRAKMSLNEITFGSTVFAGSTEILRFCVGSANASSILYSGDMYRADEALRLGLIHEVAPLSDIESAARKAATNLGSKPGPAFASIKLLLRKPIADDMIRREPAAIADAVDMWYSDATWANLQKVKTL